MISDTDKSKQSLIHEVSGCLNQHWIKLNKKRDNLPTENCKCWIWTKDGLMFGEYNSTARNFYGWREIEFSHYMIIYEPVAPNK